MKYALTPFLVFALTTIGSTAPTPAAGEVSPITEEAVCKNGKPDSFVGSVHPAVDPGVGRIPLVLSLSPDGIHFDQHFILGDQHRRRRFDGAAKGGDYSYPHSVVFDAHLYVIVARQKETIEVFSVAPGDVEGKSQPEQRQESRP